MIVLTELQSWGNQLLEVVAASRALNSNFVTSLIGAGAGAWAGAYAAQRIADRAKSREELLKELRNTNRAFGVAAGICNTMLGLKAQHVQKLKNSFDQQKAALGAFQDSKSRGEIAREAIFRFPADLETIAPLQLPVDILQTLVFDKISLIGRPLSLAPTIAATVHDLNNAIITRNQLAEYFRTAGLPHDTFARAYFGLPDEAGNIDFRYPSAVDAISSLTDDCIFFSKLLSEDLISHGKNARALFASRFGRKAPNISEANFENAERRGLLPPPENYTDWLRMFMVRPTKPTLLKRLALIFQRVRRRTSIWFLRARRTLNGWRASLSWRVWRRH